MLSRNGYLSFTNASCPGTSVARVRIRHNVLYVDSRLCYRHGMNGPLSLTSSQPITNSEASDLSTDEKVAAFLHDLLSVSREERQNPAAALLPWICDRLLSRHSRRAYASDLAAFVRRLRDRGIEPLQVTGDDLRMYKSALLAAGHTTASVARTLSVLRGTYQQFGKRGLIPWEQVRDIQSVESPRVEKNTTPCLSQQEAIRLLHAPDTTKLMGRRDFALLFVFFKTAARLGDRCCRSHGLFPLHRLERQLLRRHARARSRCDRILHG